MTARKIMLLGEIGVGKSSIVRRLVFDRFEAAYSPTIGVDVYRYEVPPADTFPGLTLIVWDTDGNFLDAIFRHVYVREATAALVVGDVSRPGTLETMARLADGFLEHLPGRHCAMVMNKIDLLPADTPLHIPDSVVRRHLSVYETSAATGTNIKHAVHHTAATIWRRGL